MRALILLASLALSAAAYGTSPDELAVMSPASLCKEQTRLSELLVGPRSQRLLYSKKKMIERIKPYNAAIAERGINCAEYAAVLAASKKANCYTRTDPYGNMRSYCE